MKIKTNLRAGSGGASGAGKNSTTSDPIVILYNYGIYVDPTIGVTRCVGV
jgi:hypothetical protein